MDEVARKPLGEPSGHEQDQTEQYQTAQDQTEHDQTEHDWTAQVDAELPEVQREAQSWLVDNNQSDIKTITAFALLLFLLCLPGQAWWGVFLGACVLAVVPNRLIVARFYERGEIQKGLLLSNCGSWAIAFPIVAIVPDALGISLILLLGPLVLAATYFESRLMRVVLPIGLAIGTALSVIGLTAEGANLERFMPWPVYIAGMVVFSVSQVYLMLSDVRETHYVRMRLLIRAVRLNRELRASEMALRKSRQRLVAAADNERGRIERDLHDGAQQRLLALSVQLRLAAELAEEGTPISAVRLRQLGDDATVAVQELRELAHGVYPARLHDLGVVSSLRSVTQTAPVPVEVVDAANIVLPQEVRLATYFICLEAIQNATKHGDDDTAASIRFDQDGSDLAVSITDTGPGFDLEEATSSRGLANMHDRAAAIGGSLTVASEPGTGTSVSFRLPLALASEAAA